MATRERLMDPLSSFAQRRLQRARSRNSCRCAVKTFHEHVDRVLEDSPRNISMTQKSCQCRVQTFMMEDSVRGFIGAAPPATYSAFLPKAVWCPLANILWSFTCCLPSMTSPKFVYLLRGPIVMIDVLVYKSKALKAKVLHPWWLPPFCGAIQPYMSCASWL